MKDLTQKLMALLLGTAICGPALAAMELEQQEDRYREAIETLESSEGAYSGALPEQLLSLGLNLQQSGRHEEAVKLFRRGVHLARINNGLYGAEQMPLIEREIASHVALGQYSQADERQRYLYRVQMRNLESGLGRADALMQQAHWQYQAYRLAVEGDDYSRLLSMWDLYRLALNDIVAREGETSVTLIQPLQGMLLSQYLIAGYQYNGQNSSSQGSDNFSAQQSANRFNAYRSQSYTKGRAVIQAIYDIQKANRGENSAETAESLTMMGDWSLWNGEEEAALQFYQGAVAELVAGGAAEEDVDKVFGAPVALPDFDGARTLPPSVEAGEGLLQLEFTVNAGGKVRDLQRLDENDLSTGKVNRIMRSLRKTRFRPALAMGEPISTEKVTRNYAVHPPAQ
jgi:hypothetical protein